MKRYFTHSLFRGGAHTMRHVRFAAPDPGAGTGADPTLADIDKGVKAVLAKTTENAKSIEDIRADAKKNADRLEAFEKAHPEPTTTKAQKAAHDGKDLTSKGGTTTFKNYDGEEVTVELPKLEGREKNLRFTQVMRALAFPHQRESQKVLFDHNAREKVLSKALQIGTDSEGGYTTFIEYMAELIRIVEEFGVARRMCRNVTMSQNQMDFPSLATTVSASWVDEEAASVETDPAFGQVRLTAEKALFHTIVSAELLEDGNPDIASILFQIFGEAMAKAEDIQFFTGGIDEDSDPFDGLYFMTGVNTVDLDPTADPTFDDIIDLIAAISIGARNGAWLFFNSTVEAKLSKLKGSDGQYVWRMPTEEAPGTILGKPYAVSDEIVDTLRSTSKTGGDETTILYGNPLNYFFGNRAAFAIKSSDQLRILNDQIVFVGRERVALKAAIPGAFARMTGVKTT